MLSLKNSTILVTGATGLIGKALIATIHKLEPSCHIIALVHSLEKAKLYFKQEDWLSIIEADVNNPFSVDNNVDYIIHGASVTSSKKFVEEPVTTILTSINGTRNLLELAREKNVKSFVYLSTMEIYGAPETDEKILETSVCNIDSMQKRSSYPESKRLCETLCTAYYTQFDVPAKVVRLTQTIGPGIEYNDGRVFAEFARCAIEKKDIILHTKGLTKRMYISTDDAAYAILDVLLKGENGLAYNAANEETYCTVFEMAQLVAEKICNNNISVKIVEEDTEKFGYAPVLKMNLDTKRLKTLGWQAKDSLEEMYVKLIESMKGK